MSFVGDMSRYLAKISLLDCICVCSIVFFGYAWLTGSTDLYRFWMGFLGHPYGDMPDHVWGNEWFARCLEQGRLPWFVEDTYFPDRSVLWNIDWLGGVFRFIFSMVPNHWVWNVWIWFHISALGVSVYGISCWLFARWEGRLSSTHRIISLIASVMILSSNYIAGLIHSGLSEYLSVYWLFLLYWAIRSDSRYTVWVCGLLLAITGMHCFAYGIFGVLLVLLYTEYKQWWKIALLPMCTVIPLLYIVYQSTHHPLSAFTANQAPGWNFARLPALDVWGYLAIGDFVFPDTRLRNPGILQSHALGWSMIFLIVLGLYQSKDWVWKREGILTILGLGPRLVVYGVGVLPLLPLGLLYFPYSPFSFLHHPYHIVAMVYVLYLPFLLKGMNSLPKRYIPVFLGLWGYEKYVDVVEYPFAITTLAEDVVVEGARLDWPPDASTANRRYLLHQTQHHQPIAMGINRWMSKSVFQDSGVQRWLRLLDDPFVRAINRDVPPREQVLLDKVDLSAPSSLANMGFRWIVVHREFLQAEEERKIIAQLTNEFGEYVQSSHTQYVFQIAQ